MKNTAIWDDPSYRTTCARTLNIMTSRIKVNCLKISIRQRQVVNQTVTQSSSELQHVCHGQVVTVTSNCCSTADQQQRSPDRAAFLENALFDHRHIRSM